MNVIHISDLSDAALGPYSRLTEAQLRNRLHPTDGLFICESAKVIRIALEHGVQPMSFLCEEKFLPQVEELMSGHDVPVYTAERSVLASLTGYELSRGMLCAMHRPQERKVADMISGDMRRVAVLDGVVNSENTGAIFRAAAALGIDAVLLTRTCCDPLNRRACRVSMGTVFQLPWTFLDSYNQLKECGFSVVALALTDRSVPIDDASLRDVEHMAIVLGSEGDGLDDNVLRLADHITRIPMQRGVDSLNVAAAAAVAFWQLR